MSQDSESLKARKTTRGKEAKGRKPERLKVSLLLSKENDIRLTVLSALKGTDRSMLINSILDTALRGVVVSLRGPLALEGQGGMPEAEADSDA